MIHTRPSPLGPYRPANRPLMKPLPVALSSMPRIAGLSALLLGAGVALAQTPPDAGQTLQRLQPPLAPPAERAPLTLTAPAGAAAAAPGGPTVVLRSVNFTGNTVFDAPALQRLVAASVGQPLDLAGLRGLADRVSQFYRDSGYPFARAYLPAQDLRDGDLSIALVEGRFGSVRASSDRPEIATAAQPYLAALQPGEVIQRRPLERAALALEDLPGISTALVLRPGTADGTGDLDVQVRRDRGPHGSIGLDNHGDRYTGRLRLRADLDLNSPWMLGDQLTLRLLASEADLRLGSLGYSLPWGTQGWRASVGYSRTRYALGEEFASLLAHGTADVITAGLARPLLRTALGSLTLSVSYQAKRLQDRQDSTATSEHKTARTVPVTLQFDRRDASGSAAGLTFGAVTWTPGRLAMDEGLAQQDGNHTRGRYDKLTTELVRLQPIAPQWTAMGRLFNQIASKNLDSAEKTSLGGASGVRAYPAGETTGDEATLAQLEVRYSGRHCAPYAFFDIGTARSNAHPSSSTQHNHRSLAGAGWGVRTQWGPWAAELAWARRTQGGTPVADPSDHGRVRMWASASVKF